MNFNYTNQGFSFENGRGNNVHGSIGNIVDESQDSTVIFGTNLTDSKYDVNKYMFTKTFRKMIYDGNNPVQKIPPKEYTNSITFYGHSLGDADYAYFQSIFDYYNLYSSEITVIFAYTVFDEKDRDEIVFSNLDRVSRLLNRYGKSLKNDYIGDNLQHKLLLEKRLVLKEIVGIVTA